MDYVKDSPVGIVERFIAFVVDLIVIFTIASIAGLLYDTSVIVIAVISSYIYAITLPLLWNGYTIGKRFVGIRIASITNEKLSLSMMVKRELLAGLLYSICAGILTLVSILIMNRNDRRSIHDLVASTYVTSNYSEY
ncbi:RDD family protein [Oceanobacillus limi]|uniref:RDD family protein n=1 Tax=Oceanobacillus limi TaxID=930131 RepID=A0A1I0C4Y8_9BACI|nr:RDD family protein [Oceanobacillus limi]SET14238.1 RDD family protein [Oceanobacillus limi]